MKLGAVSGMSSWSASEGTPEAEPLRREGATPNGPEDLLPNLRRARGISQSRLTTGGATLTCQRLPLLPGAA